MRPINMELRARCYGNETDQHGTEGKMLQE